MSKLFLMAVLVMGLGQVVSAQTPGQQEVDQRVQNQDARIKQGEANGTMSEARGQHLENKDARIENRVNNGTESVQRANRQLNRDSRRIRRAKHNQ